MIHVSKIVGEIYDRLFGGSFKAIEETNMGQNRNSVSKYSQNILKLVENTEKNMEVWFR